jgi:predicted ester cyclase
VKYTYSMPPEQNKELIQRVYAEGFNKGILAVVDEVFAPNFLDRSTPDQVPGTDGVKEYITTVRRGFPDIYVTIEDTISTENQVVVRTTWHGTHLGYYEDIAPTGKEVTRTMIQIFYVANGKLLEEWSEGDSLRQKIAR